MALGTACDIAAQEMASEATRLLQFRQRFLAQLRHESGPAPLQVNGSLEHRLPGNLNVSFHGVDAEALVMALRNQVALSTGSACTSEHFEVSHVLRALGLPEAQAESAMRIGFGRFTSADETHAPHHG